MQLTAAAFWKTATTHSLRCCRCFPEGGVSELHCYAVFCCSCFRTVCGNLKTRQLCEHFLMQATMARFSGEMLP